MNPYDNVNYQAFYEAKHNETANEQPPKKKFDWKLVLAIASGALAMYAIAVAVGCARDNAELRKLLEDSTRRLEKMTDVEIDQRIVNTAVDRAVEKAANSAVDKAVDKISTKSYQQVDYKINEAVKNITSTLNTKVAEAMAKEVDDVSKKDIVNDIVNLAVEKLTEKLEEDVDSELGRAGEIYKNIVESLT